MAPASRAASLRDYYGLQQEQPEQREEKEEEEEEKKEAPSVEQMAATQPLDALLRQSLDLMEGIRELNADRQSLVYNHHQELVAASETVGKMRRGLDGLRPSREALQKQFASMETHRQTIAQHTPAAEEIDWQGAVAPLVSLPATLQQLRNSDKEDAARELYASYQTTLTAWADGGVEGARDLQRECEDVLQRT